MGAGLVMHGKILFANQLRGLAALFVVASHLGAVFWGMREIVAAHIGAPIYSGSPALTLSWLSFRYLSLGPFGVAVFFLISGFVIPISLEKLEFRQFLISRFFRIYPTYVACVTFGLGVVMLSAHMYGMPFPWDRRSLVTNYTLTHTFLGYDAVDLVNWTLAIEVKFYLVAAIIAPFIRRARILPLFAASALCLLFNFAVRHAPLPGWSFFTVRGLASEFMFVSFMLIGVVYHYAWRQAIGRRGTVLSVAGLFGLFTAAFAFSTQAPDMRYVYPSYAIGLAVFSACYFARDRFRPVRILDFFADISYPLYLVHSLLGYVVIRRLLDHGVNMYLCEATAVLCAISIAWLIHMVVEKPTAEFGKWLAKIAVASRMREHRRI